MFKYSYEHFTKDVKLITNKYKSEKIDSIIGIARGGLTLTHFVAEALHVRDVSTISTKLYDGDKKRESIEVNGIVSLKKNSKVLVLDDISDSGDTLRVVMRMLQEKNPHVEFITATIFYKKSSSFEPDLWINEATEWIEFFWES